MLDTLLARPGTASIDASSSYVSPLTRVLPRARWVLLAVLFVWAFCCFLALQSIATATKTIGEDTAASIVDAEKARAVLADANAQLAKAALVNDGTDGRFASALRQDMREAETVLVDAASKITFGAEESGPLVTMARGIADYERLVGAAQGTGNGTADGPARITTAVAADAVMHFTILPAAETLDRANLAHLTESYQAYQGQKTLRFIVMLVVSLVLALLLLSLQLYLFQKTNRILNPGLVATSVIVLAMSVFVGIRFTEGSHALYVAKEQAFDSIAALASARAIAHDVDAARSFWLLATGDTVKQGGLAAAFGVRAARLVRGDVGAALEANAAGQAFQGLLGDELANITFAGERDTATATLKRWADYIAIDKRIRAEAVAGRAASAVALATGDEPGQSARAFAAFEDALNKTIGINQAEFDAAIARSEAIVDPSLHALLAAAWLAASASLWLGIAQRLKRYAF